MSVERDLQFLFKDKYRGHWQKEFLKDAERVREGEPLDFVIGWTPFLGSKIDLRFRPLIPRPETEYWTERAIEEIKIRKSAKVLDIFSGSGAIGIAVLKHCKGAKVDFAEYEPELVKQIKLNLRLNKISSKRYKVFRSDVFKDITGKYDLILANPPYIPKARKAKVGKAVIKYEKASSLWGGQDGLYFIKKFLKEAKSHLLPDGEVWMEFDAPEKEKIGIICAKLGYEFKPQKDHYKRWRYAIIKILT